MPDFCCVSSSQHSGLVHERASDDREAIFRDVDIRGLAREETNERTNAQRRLLFFRTLTERFHVTFCQKKTKQKRMDGWMVVVGTSG